MSPTMRQQGQHDGSAWPSHEREVAPVFEEPVTIKRWIGQSAGNPDDGVAPTDAFTLIKTTANISEMPARDLFLGASVYLPGDLQAEFRTQVFGSEAANGDNTGQRKPDQVLYRNRPYYLVGHVHRLNENGRVYWQGVLRLTGS